MTEAPLASSPLNVGTRVPDLSRDSNTDTHVCSPSRHTCSLDEGAGHDTITRFRLAFLTLFDYCGLAAMSVKGCLMRALPVDKGRTIVNAL